MEDKMSVRDLIPWGRGSPTPAPRGQDPFLALHREVNRLFDDFWRDFSLPGFGSFGAFGRGAWPRLDIAETDKEVRVTAELPGLEEKDVELTLTETLLTLRGEKRSETEDGEGVHLTERIYGAFERTIPLGAEIDRDRVKASFKNGVLTIVLPKTASAQEQSKRIPITTS
jgi:HSP20 family protein